MNRLRCKVRKRTSERQVASERTPMRPHHIISILQTVDAPKSPKPFRHSEAHMLRLCQSGHSITTSPRISF